MAASPSAPSTPGADETFAANTAPLQIVITVTDGRKFPHLPAAQTSLTLAFAGQTLSSARIAASQNPTYDTRFAFSLSARALSTLKSQRSPLKLVFYTHSTAHPDEPERLGYIVLDLRAAPRTRSLAARGAEKWYPLADAPARPFRPEARVAFAIYDAAITSRSRDSLVRSASALGSNEMDAADRRSDAGHDGVDDDGAVAGMVGTASGADPAGSLDVALHKVPASVRPREVTLTNDGYYAVGPGSATWVLALTLAFADALDALVANAAGGASASSAPQGPFAFTLSILGTPCKTPRFARLEEPVFDVECVAIRLRGLRADVEAVLRNEVLVVSLMDYQSASSSSPPSPASASPSDRPPVVLGTSQLPLAQMFRPGASQANAPLKSVAASMFPTVERILTLKTLSSKTAPRPPASELTAAEAALATPMPIVGMSAVFTPETEFRAIGLSELLPAPWLRTVGASLTSRARAIVDASKASDLNDCLSPLQQQLPETAHPQQYRLSIDLRAIRADMLLPAAKLYFKYQYSTVGTFAPFISHPAVGLQPPEAGYATLPPAFCAYEFVAARDELATWLAQHPLQIECWQRHAHAEDACVAVATVAIVDVLRESWQKVKPSSKESPVLVKERQIAAPLEWTSAAADSLLPPGDEPTTPHLGRLLVGIALESFHPTDAVQPLDGRDMVSAVASSSPDAKLASVASNHRQAESFIPVARTASMRTRSFHPQASVDQARSVVVPSASEGQYQQRSHVGEGASEVLGHIDESTRHSPIKPTATTAAPRLASGQHPSASAPPEHLDKSSMETSIHDTPEYQAALDLELWKQREEAAFLAKLQEREATLVTSLAQQFRHRETQRLTELEAQSAHVRQVEREMRQMIEDVETRARELAAGEAALARERDAYEHERRLAQAHDKARRERHAETDGLALELAETRYAALESENAHVRDRLAEAELEKVRLREEVLMLRAQQQAPTSGSQESPPAGSRAIVGGLVGLASGDPREKGAGGATDVVLLRRELDEARNRIERLLITKGRYKAYAVKLTSKVAALQKELQSANQTELEERAVRAGAVGGRAALAAISRELAHLALEPEDGPGGLYTGTSYLSQPLPSFQAPPSPPNHDIRHADDVLRPGPGSSSVHEPGMATFPPTASKSTSHFRGTGAATKASDATQPMMSPSAAIAADPRLSRLPPSLQNEVKRLFHERRSLMATGLYEQDDQIIARLDSRISDLLGNPVLDPNQATTLRVAI
ncbi:hypothetical protein CAUPRSCDRAFT_10603 [Caulochytrium protostelioides]|uniref:C2 domain-containing protein n=1 Tax=Caulochytrium protostelioides TaxID=1555241 RepID=A0A4P9WYU5_9FUNG|nr:hypothetical protein CAUPRSCDRAFT_10603 [Caulochytrium protostelioides]